jgi:hypothetical protein
MKKIAISIISFGLTCVFGGVAFGAVINVPTPSYPTIQAGINAASSGDTVLVANGTYTGAGNKNLDFGGKALTVKSENGPDNCIIDCEGDGRGFYFHSGEGQESVMSGFTIINAKGLAGTIGSGIICESSSPKIANCIISNGQAENGGGINCLNSSSPNISNCIIENNSNSNGWGAGIYCLNSSPNITNCTQFCPVRKKQAVTACLLWFCLSPLAAVQITPLKNTF